MQKPRFELETVLATVKSALRGRFVFCDQVASIIALAVATGKNALLWGAPGHGKSEMVNSALQSIFGHPFTQTFGEGMTEDRLFGGIDLLALEKEKVLKYHTESSFLAAEVAVFEEIFDAPPSVLLSLKDTLTAKELRNGAQRVQMKARCVIALTNTAPQEIASLGAAAKALVERFPLQLNVEWADYSPPRYEEMLVKLGYNETVSKVIAALCGVTDKNQQNCQISPRSAVHAAQLYMVGGADALAFIPELSGKIPEVKAAEEAEAAVKAAEAAFVAVEAAVKALGDVKPTPIGHLKAAKAAKAAVKAAENLSVPDAMYKRRKALIDKAVEWEHWHLKQALETTRED